MTAQSARSDRMLTTAQVGDRLQITPDQVVALINKKKLPATDVSVGRRPLWRVRPEDVEAFITARRPAAPQPRARRQRRETVTPYF